MKTRILAILAAFTFSAALAIAADNAPAASSCAANDGKCACQNCQKSADGKCTCENCTSQNCGKDCCKAGGKCSCDKCTCGDNCTCGCANGEKCACGQNDNKAADAKCACQSGEKCTCPAGQCACGKSEAPAPKN